MESTARSADAPVFALYFDFIIPLHRMKTTSTRPDHKPQHNPGTSAQGHEAVQRFALPNDHIQTALPHDAMPQHGHAHMRESAPVQMARIPVGFDRVGVATSAADSLVTSGLENCIAIAVQDTRTRVAAMGHYNTSQCFDGDGKVIAANLVAFRSLMLNELERAAGAAPNPVFRIAVGGQWMSQDEKGLSDGHQAMRFNLLMACRQVFGTEPTVGGTTAEFFLGTGIISGNGFRSEAEESDIQPSDDKGADNAGDPIPYERLRSDKVRGHKLDKNLGFVDKLFL